MSKSAPKVALSASRDIPFNRLVLSQANVRRIKAGIAVDKMAWTDDRLDFAMAAMGQKVDGQVDVRAETVRVEVRLPLLLALFAQQIQKRVGKEGNLLLTKK